MTLRSRVLAAPDIAAADTNSGQKRASFWKIAFLVFLFYVSSGFPFALINVPIFYGSWVVSVIILIGTAIYMIHRRGRRFDGWDRGILALMTLCLVVSAISNTLIFPQELSGWLPAFHTIMPLLLIFLLKAVNISSRDVATALVIIGVTAGILLTLDHALQFSFMEAYQRLATTDTSLRRIVFLKNELAFATIVIVSRIAFTRSSKAILIYLMLLAPIGYSLIVISESRLAIGATLMACAVFTVVVVRGTRLFAFLLAGGLAALIILPLALGKYIDQIERSRNYLEQDSSIRYRLVECEYFYNLFQKTSGVGFGIMSTGTDKKNPLAFAEQSYAMSTGYGLYIADIGILSALVQFGYIGVVAVVAMTIKVGVFLLRNGRRSSLPGHKEAAGLGAIVLCLFFNPWPLNLFTLQWTAMSGGLVWYVAARCAQEIKQAGVLSSRSTGMRQIGATS